MQIPPLALSRATPARVPRLQAWNPRTWQIAVVLLLAVLLPARHAHADAVTEWNARACDTLFAAQMPPPLAARAMAIVQTAVDDAVRSSSRATARAASVDAAIAAANRVALSKLAPAQRSAIEEAYRVALSTIPDGATRDRGIAQGERSAAAVLALRAGDDRIPAETWRPKTEPGRYLPTQLPAVLQWPQRKPWLLARPDQFRPAPPPALGSALWARDYSEIKALGARTGSRRSEAQTRAAQFWEASEPAIYAQVVRSVAEMPGRDIARNARLYAAVHQAIDDALIAVFDAKHHYGFWRPLTAIRNGDIDGNDATARDPSWLPLIETPAHPEYPCAHCIIASTVGTVLKAELGDRPTPLLRSTSSKAPGVTRTWTRIDDLVAEVAEARICDGVHYRNSTEVGIAMGARIGALAARKHGLARE